MWSITAASIARDVGSQVDFESKVWRQLIMIRFQALSSRRFQRGFHRSNLHRPTETTTPPSDRAYMVRQCMSKLKAQFAHRILVSRVECERSVNCENPGCIGGQQPAPTQHGFALDLIFRFPLSRLSQCPWTHCRFVLVYHIQWKLIELCCKRDKMLNEEPSRWIVGRFFFHKEHLAVAADRNACQSIPATSWDAIMLLSRNEGPKRVG